MSQNSCPKDIVAGCNNLRLLGCSIFYPFTAIHYGLQFLTRDIRAEKVFLKQSIQWYGQEEVRVLDFGCGEGFAYDAFKGDSRVRYVGVDKDIIPLKFAKSKTSGFCCVSGNHNLCFKPDSFDAILAINVFHHMPEKKRLFLLSEAALLLKDKGLFVVIELDPGSKQGSIILKTVVFLEEIIKKIQYCRSEFWGSFKNHGFELVQKHEFNQGFTGYVFIKCQKGSS